MAQATPDSPCHTAIRLLIQHEHQREIARFLRLLEGKPYRKSVTQVQDIDPHGQLQSFCTQEEIEQALLIRSLERRFRLLTDTSPLMQPLLSRLLGTGLLTPVGRQILAGDPPIELPQWSPSIPDGFSLVWHSLAQPSRSSPHP